MLTPDYLVFLVDYELLLTVLVLFVSANILWRFWRMRRIALLYLALVFILFSFAVFFTAWSHSYHLSLYPLLLQDYMYNGYMVFFRVQGQLYAKLTDWMVITMQGGLTGLIYIFAFSIALAELGNLFLFAFSIEAFLEEKRKWMALYALVFAPSFALTLVSFNVSLNFVLALVTGLITYIPLAYLSIKAMRMTEQRVYRYGFLMITLTAVFLSLFFVFLFVESALTEGWSIFIPIAWTMGLFAGISAYIGYVLPNWFRKLVGETK
ncbi:MAG: hypothetical protein ACTSSA_04230 [Candidatus Freyarchaeota archaeon]